MNPLKALQSLLKTAFRRQNVELDMEEELRSHVQHRADDLVRSGVTRNEAERLAAIEFGGYEHYKEECRESVGVHLLETVVQDLRFGLRVLRKSPGFTTVAILTLALGIGANTAIFSLINTVMLRFLPVEKPEELVQVLRFNPARGGRPTTGFTNALWEQLRDNQQIFSGIFSWSDARFDLAQGGAVHYANGIFTSGNYFTTLGVRPALGRLFTPTDDQRGCASLAVLSYGFWQEHFGGDRNAIGATLSLNKRPFQVIGVSSPGFYGMEVGDKFDVAVPICSAAVFDEKQQRLDTRDWWWLRIAGRLKPGISPEQATAQLKVLSPVVWGGAVPQDWNQEGQQDFRKRLLLATPAATGTSQLRAQFSRPLAILMGVVALVLLIATANLASLMLARAASRTREIAVRKALGASRSRLVRQLLTECLLVSCAGALLGVFFARWGTVLLVRYISTGQSTVFLDLSLNGPVFAFTALIAVLSALLFGILPALRSTRVSLTAAMKGGQAEHADQRSHLRFGSRQWIVSSQIALSLVLLVVAGLFLHSVVKLVTLDLGFDRSNVLLISANVQVANVPATERPAVYDQMEERLRSLPGVTSVGRSFRTPISQYEWNQEIVVDSPNAPKGEEALTYLNSVSAGYFSTLRIPLVAGRNFEITDTKTSIRVAIVNETFAHKFFPGMYIVGKTFRLLDGRAGDKGIPVQIIGLMKDSKYETVQESMLPQAFFSAAQVQEADNSEIFAVRTGSRPSALVPLAQAAIAQVNKGVALEFSSLSEQVDDSLIQERLLATLSSFFGALALLLAMIGLYGAISYAVMQRRLEFGVRMALGAVPGSILQLVMREVAVVLLAGAVAGVAISLLAVRLVQKLIFGASAYDPLAIAGAIILLAIVALLAGYLPARRAMRVDPMVALRYE